MTLDKKMKTIIPYCTAGVGNRMRTIASCGVISQMSDRTLKIYWDNKQQNGCLAPFNELFKNKIETISLEELQNLNNCSMCVEKYDANRENWEFGVPVLQTLTDKFGANGKDSFSFNDEKQNVIVYNIRFLSNIDLDKSHEFLRSLKLAEELQNNVDKVITTLGLNKNVIGIHARGSDFNVPVTYYINKIRDVMTTHPNQMFYLSTEDKNYENTIVNTFKNNILVRTDKNNYIHKTNNLPWSHKTFVRDGAHSKEALEDLYILSKTNLQIYHELSTYAEIAKIL